MCQESWFYETLGPIFSTYRAAQEIPKPGPSLGLKGAAGSVVRLGKRDKVTLSKIMRNGRLEPVF
jgi:hypothetical protein